MHKYKHSVYARENSLSMVYFVVKERAPKNGVLLVLLIHSEVNSKMEAANGQYYLQYSDNKHSNSVTTTACKSK